MVSSGENKGDNMELLNYLYLMHVINMEDNRILLKPVCACVPSVGDEIRTGGEDHEKFYKVVSVVWVFDEYCPQKRVNIGVEFVVPNRPSDNRYALRKT